MKGFAKIALAIALLAIVVLSIVVASVAWFTSNPEVNANDVTLNSAKTLTVTFDPNVEGTNYKYHGQIGNVASGIDAPYVYEAGGFSVDITSLSTPSKRGTIKVEFGTVNIITQSSGTIPDVLITDLFHITANAYTEDTDGGYVKDGTDNHFRAYVAATDSALTRYAKAFTDLTIADDGMLTTTEDSTPTTALFEKKKYELSFTYTFLPDAAYAVWAAAAALDPTGTTPITDVYGYELAADGNYIGVVSYVAYKAKYHYGLQRYNKSEEADLNGNYTYTPDGEGAYVRVVTSYQTYNTVTKYTSAAGAGEGAANGSYIKVGDSGEYVAYSRYNSVPGFPYSNDRYRGEKFTFAVGCSVEEVDNEA